MPMLWPDIAWELIRESNKTIFWGEVCGQGQHSHCPAALHAQRSVRPRAQRVPHSLGLTARRMRSLRQALGPFWQLKLPA